MSNQPLFALGRCFAMAGIGLMIMFWQPLSAEILVPPTPGNQLTVDVDAQVTRDLNTGVYTYNYTVSNGPGSIQEMWMFAVEYAPGIAIFNPTVPPGWRFAIHNDRPIVSWAAVEIGELPPDFVDDGNVVPSPFDVKPDETLGGFSFQTIAGPDQGKFYAQGFKKLPQVSGDAGELDEAGLVEPHFTEDSFTSLTETPSLTSYGGGRRPAVDGFLVFLNMQKSGNVFASPATVVVKFSASGENVNRSTFSATLNQRDVTALFVEDVSFGGDLAAQFSFVNSALVTGRNVLITSVEGIVPGTSRTASDVDRITFEIQ